MVAGKAMGPAARYLDKAKAMPVLPIWQGPPCLLPVPCGRAKGSWGLQLMLQGLAQQHGQNTVEAAHALAKVVRLPGTAQMASAGPRLVLLLA